MTSLNLQQLADLAAQSTIDKIKDSDAFDVVAAELAQAWEKAKESIRGAARAGRRRYQFDFKSACCASREEMAKLMPKDLAAMQPWVWHHPQLDLYEFSISWELQCDKIVEEFEAEQRAARKRKLAQEAEAEAVTCRRLPASLVDELPEAQPAFHRLVSPEHNWKYHHVVVDIAEKRALAHCLADDGEEVRVQIALEGKLGAVDVPRHRVLGLADMTKVYVTFEHCGKSTTARVGTDKNTSKLTVFWYDPLLKIDCTMDLSRKRLVVHPSQKLAFAQDCRARASDA